ncbi:MAG TPA: pyruvate formate lyase family protein [Planctomycetota bacterium]|nr:pyruvate formate lyase family protein [Planctomycetota bacterium]HRR80158.1 pyruvate formate lyase family protein [Planctomycetota bacterium]HRT94286.1 pyruvate formate lyase family protein [Planctomycetota bacterium]
MATTVATCGELAAATRELREEVRRDAASFSERLLLVAEAFRESEGEVYRGMRTAKATRRIFEKMPIKIRRGEILVGWHPNSRPDEVTKKAIQDAAAYLRTQTYWVWASEGHMAPDYPTLLRDGIGGTLRRIEELRLRLEHLDLATPQRQAFYDSARLSLEALQHLIRRYADLARHLAEGAGDGGTVALSRESATVRQLGPRDGDVPPATPPTTERWWAEELRTIAAVCDHIAYEPPRTFREALQLVWFLYLAVCLEASESHHCFGPGRPDQYLLPYYLRDREAGILDDATLEALLDQLFIKCNEFEGRGMSAVILVLGGRKPDGSDATNELSYRFLEACGRVRMYFPGCDISWHRGMDAEFLRCCVALLRNGNGQPAFFNDEVIVRGLVRKGIPFEHAVDHLPSTCTETSIAGRTNPWVAHPYVNIAQSLLHALFDGQAPGTNEPSRPRTGLPQTFAELRDAFVRQLEYDAHQAVARVLRDQWHASMYRLFPLLSCFIQGCLERGRDIAQGGCLYTFLQPEAVGTSNVVDGLAAVKVLVQDEKRFTLDDFRAAICANFAGHEGLRRAIVRECPKHGNDVPWVNQLFADVAGAWCTYLEGHTSLFGGPVLPGFLGWTVWIHFGEQTAATPDGRLAGQPLAHSLAHRSGVRVKGFPSLVLSASGFDQSRGLGGITFNVRFGANSLAAEGGVERLKAMIEAAMDLGTYQVQVDLASSEVLRDAQAHPENHADLLVRIGGYLVPFTLLPPKAQEDILARTELEL